MSAKGLLRIAGATIADLRLQADVKEARKHWRACEEGWNRVIKQAEGFLRERDRYKARAERRGEALERLLESYEVTYEMVAEAIERGEVAKHDESKPTSEQYRQQGIVDIARQVRIYLEDNEGVQPIADARAALAATPEGEGGG